MEWNREKTEKAFVIFGKVMLVAVVILNAWLTYKCYFNFLRSDDSSELVMSRLLSKEGGILSGNWYYSTELEILNTQLVYSLLFHFTSDFKFVRIAGQIILTILFLGSYYFCLYSMDSQKAENRFWKTAFLTILPISSAWIYLIMKAYYIPITGIGFLALGLACQAQKEGLSKKRKAVLFALGSVLAFVSCLEGLRHIQLAYLPLVAGFLWIWWNERENKEWNDSMFHLPRGFLFSVGWLCFALAGYLVNAGILSKVYHYDTQEKTFFPAEIMLETFQNVLNAFLNVTGYEGEYELVSFGGICNALAVVFALTIVYCLWKVVRNMRTMSLQMQLVSAYVLLSFGIGMFIYILVDRVEARWVMSGSVALFLLLLLLENLPWRKGYVLLAAFYMVMIVLGGREYKNICANTQNEELRDVYEFIMNSDYTFGYSTFRPGNLMTELTNGKIDLSIIKMDTANNKLKKRHWLTSTETPVYDGAFPVIMEKERIEEDFEIPEDWNMVLDTDKYWVYELSDQQAFEEYLNKREL